MTTRTFLVTCFGNDATDDADLVASDILESLQSDGFSVDSVKPWSPHDAQVPSDIPIAP